MILLSAATFDSGSKKVNPRPGRREGFVPLNPLTRIPAANRRHHGLSATTVCVCVCVHPGDLRSQK